MIGDISKGNTEIKLKDILNGIEFLVKKDIVYKYNGVEIPMQEKNIPKIIEVLVEDGIDIYSIYELYDPMV